MAGTNKAPIGALAVLAGRATQDPFYLAHPLALHRAAFRLGEAEQRGLLGVQADEWEAFQLYPVPMALCWDDDLTAICQRFGCDRGRLEGVLRIVSSEARPAGRAANDRFATDGSGQPGTGSGKSPEHAALAGRLGADQAHQLRPAGRSSPAAV
jgi:hypothetical protein